MPKPKEAPDPEVVSRDNAIGARSVESRFDPASEADALAGDLHAMGTVPGMTAANFPGTIDPASHDTQREADTQEGTQPLRRHEQELHARRLLPVTVGNVPAMPAVEPAPVEGESPCAREDGETIRRRFISEGRWRDISPVRDRMMVESKRSIPDKEARRAWVYSELDKMYPPPAEERKPNIIFGIPDVSPLLPTGQLAGVQVDAGSIQGLGEIPSGWPVLPANASLGAELGWVQANRLRIVEERPGRATSVKLGQALSPAPSWAALGWLETSIRSYAKFVDVAAKASGVEDDEGAVLRRERKSVDEVRALLQEMKAAEGSCPACGRPH
jgi:hypothetical protein